MNNGLQALLMILLTLAVGALFIIRLPTPTNEVIQELETRVARQDATLAYYQSLPTAVPTVDGMQADQSAASDSNFIAVPESAATPEPTIVIRSTAPSAQGSLPDSANKVGSVVATTEVAPSGCAVGAADRFEAFDTIYGVAQLQNMAVGDQLRVEFYAESIDTLIYEDDFTIQEGGDYCRWYVIEPDAAGWEAGTYRISYAVNNSTPVSMTYQIVGSAADFTNPLSTEGEGDAMEEDAMMEEGN